MRELWPLVVNAGCLGNDCVINTVIALSSGTHSEGSLRGS